MGDPLDHVAEAIAALGRSDAASARASMAAALTLDKSLAVVADAVEMAASQLDTGEDLAEGIWNAVDDACPSELRAVVESYRT